MICVFRAVSMVNRSKKGFFPNCHPAARVDEGVSYATMLAHSRKVVKHKIAGSREGCEKSGSAA